MAIKGKGRGDFAMLLAWMFAESRSTEATTTMMFELSFSFASLLPDVDNLSFAESKLLPLAAVSWLLMAGQKNK